MRMAATRSETNSVNGVIHTTTPAKRHIAPNAGHGADAFQLRKNYPVRATCQDIGSLVFGFVGGGRSASTPCGA